MVTFKHSNVRCIYATPCVAICPKGLKVSVSQYKMIALLIPWNLQNVAFRVDKPMNVVVVLHVPRWWLHNSSGFDDLGLWAMVGTDKFCKIEGVVKTEKSYSHFINQSSLCVNKVHLVLKKHLY
jgi:hypothetical protein